MTRTASMPSCARPPSPLVGASDRPGSIGGLCARTWREGGFSGPVYYVNPRTRPSAAGQRYRQTCGSCRRPWTSRSSSRRPRPCPTVITRLRRAGRERRHLIVGRIPGRRRGRRALEADAAGGAPAPRRAPARAEQPRADPRPTTASTPPAGTALPPAGPPRAGVAVGCAVRGDRSTGRAAATSDSRR